MLPPDPKKMLPSKADTTPDHLGPLHEVESPVGPLAPPPAVSAPPGLGTMIHALRRCALWAVPLALVLGVGAYFASLFLYPGAYTSSIVFQIHVKSSYSSDDEGHFSNVQKLYMARLLSHEVLAETLAKSQVAEKFGATYTPQSLNKALKPSFLMGAEEMTVSLAGENPEVIGAILAALREVFPKRMAAEEKKQLLERKQMLERRLDVEGDRRDPARPLTLAEQLRDKRIELARAEEAANLDGDSTGKERLTLAQTAKLTAEQTLSLRRGELQGLEAKLARRESPVSAEPSELDVQEAVARNEDYKDAKKTIAQIKEKMAQKREKVGGATLEQELAPLRRSLKRWTEYRDGIEGDVRDSLRIIAQKKAADEIKRRQREDLGLRDSLTAQIRLLEGEVAKRTREVEDIKINHVKVPPEVQNLRDQVKQYVREYDKIGEEVARLSSEMAQRPRVQPISEAFVPQERETSRSQKVALAASLLTFMGVIVGMCLLEARGKRVYSASDMQQGLGLRVIGTIPHVPAAARATQGNGVYDARYGLNEAVDAIRTVLMNSPRNDGARVILVSSALGGEGKTSLASHLAASLARAWRKTLLIDGDLRKPALHGQFSTPLEPGLSEALRGEVEFDDTVKPTTTSRLWLMPAGKVDGHSLQALAQEGLDNVFELLKEQYDFIVIDTSPVLLVPDGMLLARQADSVLLSVLKDHSRIPAVYAAQQKFEALGIRVLGTVMIGEKTEGYGQPAYPR